jgi:hypothetical protein
VWRKEKGRRIKRRGGKSDKKGAQRRQILRKNRSKVQQRVGSEHEVSKSRKKRTVRKRVAEGKRRHEANRKRAESYKEA